MEIRAFAGPMKKNEAHTFRKKWKTPPRSLTNSINKSHLAEARFRLQDVEKGLEKVGRCVDINMSYFYFIFSFSNFQLIFIF